MTYKEALLRDAGANSQKHVLRGGNTVTLRQGQFLLLGQQVGQNDEIR